MAVVRGLARKVHVLEVAQHLPGLKEENVGADEQRGEHGRIEIVAQLAAPLAGAHDLDEVFEVLAEYLFRQLARALRALFAREFAQDQARNAVVFQQAFEMIPGEIREPLGHGAVVAAQLLQALGGVGAGMAHDREVERDLGFEVMEDVGLADRSGLGNGVHRHRVEALAREQLLGRRQDTADRFGAGAFGWFLGENHRLVCFRRAHGALIY